MVKFALLIGLIGFVFWRIYRWWRIKIVQPFKEGNYAPKHTHTAGNLYINISEKEKIRRKSGFKGGEYVDYEDKKE